MHGGRIRHVFLRWARPIAPAAVALAYLALYLARPSNAVLGELLLLVGSVGCALVYRALATRFGEERALRVALPVDTLLIAGMTVTVGHPEFVSVAFFWSIGLAAFLLGARDTLVNGALATVCAGVTPYLTPESVYEIAHITDCIVLALFTVLLALMASQAYTTTEHDAVALRLAHRIRSTLDVDEVMHAAVEEIGRAVESTRIRLRLGRVSVPALGLHEWRREDREQLHFVDPQPVIARALDTGETIVVEDAATAPGDLAEFVRSYGERSFLLRPVLWGDRVLAALGIFSDRRRSWSRENALLDRVLPQVGAALAQAEAFQHERHVARMREELVANVSHELRTPLTATIGFLMTLERDDVTFEPERRDELLGVARREAQRLARLVDDLLEVARFEQGGVPLVRSRVDVAALAARAVHAVEPGGRGLRFQFDEPLHAVADGDRILQVLTNLVQNALRHGRGDVIVRGRKADDSIVVEVSDHGDGVPADLVDAVFEPFARWSGRSDSTGLGLPIARRIVEAHGGSIEYRPSSAGSPHAFVVSLPAS